ncbi:MULTISPECIES: multiheme c-type cytochrome [Desulfosediminicola]|uniref:multiheme c-type cytochrome n=1 Tax=Desulfosediminicola TaxID=2886823 RepID=UPI0010AB688C|nr:multiheme c-type cytochrome [Desulfosediminicola ganghwensis]
MRWKVFFAFLLAVLLCVTVAQAENQCLTCHEGIEPISEDPEVHDMECVECHFGDASATDAEAAHKGMFANPSDMRVIDQTCGTCHDEIVEHVKKSLHATSAGKISGTRYAWGLQDKMAAEYATYAVEDDSPEGEHAVKSLAQLPMYKYDQPESPDNHPANDYLRNQCLRCHVWSDGHQRDGDYRASGCASCHVEYSDAGLYEGGDPTIPKDQKDRPKLHRITKKITETQCLHCHNRGGRTGVSYIGTIESDGYGTPWRADGSKQPKLHGKNYNHLQANIHYERGMTCIDCHTMLELHGDGNIYLKREHALEVVCVNCHGTLEAATDMKTSRGNEMTNLAKKGDSIVLTSKLDGKEHVVPQLVEAELSPEAYVAKKAVPVHMEKLECYSCHARWASQCYGCHAKQDVSKPSGDWLQGKPGGDPSKNSMKGNRENSAYAWDESRSYVRWITPVLGINSRGKVSPLIPGCQAIFTQVDGENPLVNNKVFTTRDGLTGISHTPIHPHTTSIKARSCMDCHANRKTLGLGGGIYDIEGNFPDGAPIDFELERIVDENGTQLQAIPHEVARPFNKEELELMQKAGTCIACHKKDQKFWMSLKEKSGIKGAPNDELHQKAIEAILEHGSK